MSRENLIKNTLKLGWVSNKQLYNPFNPYLRVISPLTIDYKALYKNIDLYLSWEIITKLPQFIFKSTKTRAFHIRYNKHYLNNNFEATGLYLQTRTSCFSNNYALSTFLQTRFAYVYGAFKQGSIVRYVYNGKVFLEFDIKKISSIELTQYLDEAEKRLYYTYGVKF